MPRARAARPWCRTSQLGTGHAAAAAGEALKDFDGELMIAYGDMPLMTADTFEASLRGAGRWACHRGLPRRRSGRLWPGAAGCRRAISTASSNSRMPARPSATSISATPACWRRMPENSSRWAARLDNKNAQGEFYLTDVPALAKRDGAVCAVAPWPEDRCAGRQQPRRTGARPNGGCSSACAPVRWPQAWA